MVAILKYGRVTSTNDIALALARKGAADWTVVLADEQTAGRGRRGAKWLSPPRTNLYISLILRPEPPFRLEHMAEFGFVGSLGTVLALRDMGIDARLKWPNDVVARGKKIAGILVESLPQNEAVVLGIGINVNWTDLPQQLADSATSVALELGHCADLDECLNLVISRLEQAEALHRKGLGAVLQSWRSFDATPGREVKLARNGKQVIGRAVGVDDRGHLVVDLPSGETVTLTAAGELVER